MLTWKICRISHKKNVSKIKFPLIRKYSREITLQIRIDKIDSYRSISLATREREKERGGRDSRLRIRERMCANLRYIARFSM